MKAVASFVGVCGLALAASAQVTPVGDLTNGATQVGTIRSQTIGLADAFGWTFWTFSANVGDVINIEVDRLVGALDPASSVVFGNATGLAFGSLTGSTVFDWSGPGLSATVALGDDDDPPAIPGPFGDPNYGFVATSAGVYTIAVASFASTGSFPYDHNITVTGSTVPAPASLALLGAGALFAIRRRRA
jgi:hypothetical protein